MSPRPRPPDALATTVSARRWTLFVTILASSVAFIDMTIVNLALPAMQADLQAGFDTMQWVVEAYVLGLCALMLTGGGLADAHGRRRVLCIGAFAFGAASVWAALSTDATQLIGARALQGVAGALLAPASLAIVSAAFPAGERGRALGLWAAFSAVSTAIAPPLGGLLIELGSWRAVFLINVPVVALILIIAPWQVPESRDRDRAHGLDWPGALLAVLALGGFTYALLRAGVSSFGDSRVLGCLLAAAVAMAAFVHVERRAAAPMLPPSLFRSRAFAGLNVMTLVLFTAIGGVMFFLPMSLIQGHGYSALQAGAAMVPSMLVMFVLSGAVGRLVDRIGPTVPLVAGPWLSAAAFVALARADGPDYVPDLLVPIMLTGLGFGAWVTPLTTAVMSAAGDDRAGVASGVNNAVARTAQLIAIATLGYVATRVFNTSLDARLALAAVPAEVVGLLAEERVKLGATQIPAGFPPAHEAAVRAGVAAAFLDGFRAVAGVAAGLCVIASGIGLWSMRSARGAASPPRG